MTAITSRNPATEETVWEGTAASAQDIDAAIDKARKALAAWSALSLEKRIEYLHKGRDIIKERTEEITLAIPLRSSCRSFEGQAPQNENAATFNGLANASCVAFYAAQGVTDIVQFTVNLVVPVASLQGC